uniref:ZYG11B_0 protein n=1 Tax=Fopius arisanus TaxID=64838 RepID=A0A0C9QN69_9HYME
MFESPKSLEEVCIDFICENVLALCELQPGDSGGISVSSTDVAIDDPFRASTCEGSVIISSETFTNCSVDNISNGTAPRLSFKDPDVFLPAEISEQLLANLCEKKVLSDLTITLFDAKTTRLRHVKLKDASSLSTKGLKVLKQHKVIDLEVKGMKITINDLISCLSEWSLLNLRSLSVAKGSFIDCSRLTMKMWPLALSAIHVDTLMDTGGLNCSE